MTKAQAVFSIATSNQVNTKYSSTSTNSVLVYSYSTTVFKQTVASANASVSGEYYAKFAASTGYTDTESTTTAISTKCDYTLTSAQSTSTTQTISDNEAGFLVGDIEIMQDSDGQYWMYPVGAASWVTLKESEYSCLSGYYDFTGAADTQTGLTTKQQYGFDYLVSAG